MTTKLKGVALSVALFAAVMAITVRPAQAAIPQIQHVVIVFQENRTPDNLFHGLSALLPQADIADTGPNMSGQTITLSREPLANTYDLAHTHQAFVDMYDNGKMDGAGLIPCEPAPGTTCPTYYPQFRYVETYQVAPYFSIAVNYGFANRMFQNNQGPSFPAHQFIISGTSQPNIPNLFFASENPSSPGPAIAGCIAPNTEQVYLNGPNGALRIRYPCFEHQTLIDLLNNRHLSWRYYTPSVGSIWTGPTAVSHLCVAAGSPLACTGAAWTNGDMVLKPAQVLTDIQQNKLASVSWVIPTGATSDHAKLNNGSGPSWVASIVNAIGASPYWNNTVILITWDDWGGWYDHVPPPIDKTYGYYENGFRVPLLVVSAYTPAGYVSQQTHTFGSILKFIETTYGLPVIPPGTFADAWSDDLGDFFNFTKPPRTFVPIPAPLGPDYFIHDTTPVTDPDDE